MNINENDAQDRWRSAAPIAILTSGPFFFFFFLKRRHNGVRIEFVFRANHEHNEDNIIVSNLFIGPQSGSSWLEENRFQLRRRLRKNRRI